MSNFDKFAKAQISLFQQSIWKLEQARELFQQATIKDEQTAEKFTDLIEDVQWKIDMLYEQMEEKTE
jgi:hypothetical protein